MTHEEALKEAIDHINRLVVALKPFTDFATNVGYDPELDTVAWGSSIHRESISTWFGPKDFAYALFAVNDTSSRLHSLSAPPAPARDEEIERLTRERDELQQRLLTAYAVKAECNDEANFQRHRAIQAEDILAKSANGSRPLPYDREDLGRFVREAWVRWAATQPNPKPSWLVPYEELSEPDKEADRQIGEAVARWTLIGASAEAALQSERAGSGDAVRVKPLDLSNLLKHAFDAGASSRITNTSWGDYTPEGYPPYESIKSALTVDPDRPATKDWTVDDSLTARKILLELGIGDNASLEPCSDRRRDKIAGIIRSRIDAADRPPTGKEENRTPVSNVMGSGSVLECLKDARSKLTDSSKIDLAYIDEVIGAAMQIGPPDTHLERIAAALKGLMSIVSDSVGVSGYEPGRVTTWDEFPEIEAARTVLPTMNLDEAHPDDIAVDRFAAAMKAKLAKKRDEGRGGWEDKDQCSQIFLTQLLRENVEKGDPVNVGNFAMMLHQREERIASLLEALQGD